MMINLKEIIISPIYVLGNMGCLVIFYIKKPIKNVKSLSYLFTKKRNCNVTNQLLSLCLFLLLYSRWRFTTSRSLVIIEVKKNKWCFH